LCLGDEPDPPINVRAHVIDSKTIDITWQRPPRRDPLHPLVAYSVNHWPTLGKFCYCILTLLNTLMFTNRAVPLQLATLIFGSADYSY